MGNRFVYGAAIMFLEAQQELDGDREFEFFLAYRSEFFMDLDVDTRFGLRERMKDPRTVMLFDAWDLELLAVIGVYGTQDGVIGDWREACHEWGDPTVAPERVDAAITLGQKYNLMPHFNQLTPRAG